MKLWAQGKDDPEMKKIAKECEKEVYELWQECVAEEKAWAEYLSYDGSHDWFEYYTSQSIRRIHCKQTFESTWIRCNL